MNSKTRVHNVLVIQPRLNPEIFLQEQAIIINITKNIDVTLTFVNPLLNDNKIQWSNPKSILNTFGSTIWLGSGDIDLSQPTQAQKKYLNTTLRLAQMILAENEPSLGICLGHQTLALAGGAKIARINDRSETGTTLLKFTTEGGKDAVFRSVPNPTPIVLSHKDSVVSLPPDYTILGYTIRDPNSALRRGNIITLQGHPEITETDDLRNKMASAPQHTLDGYVLTYPFVDPGRTDLIIINFLTRAIH